MTDLITKLQKKPYETRVRILWTTVFAVVIVLLGVLVFSIKNTLQDVGGNKLFDLNPAAQSSAPLTQIPYASVERMERTEKVLKIYFNFNNPTDDILNISQLSDIRLSFDGGSLVPQNIADRQNDVFVRKILSHTQNFGILIFSPIGSSKATLTFDQMYLESNPNNIFQQKLELDLDELNQPSNLRN